MKIHSTGARLMSEAQASRCESIATAIQYDLEHYPHPPEVVAECRRRIEAHRAEASQYRSAIEAWDNRFRDQLPEQLRKVAP